MTGLEIGLSGALVICIGIIIILIDDKKEMKKEYKKLETRLEDERADRNYWKEEYFKEGEKIRQHSENVIDFVRKRAVEETSKNYIDYIKEILYTLHFRHGEKEFEIDPRAEKMKDSIDIEETNLPDQNKTLRVVFKSTKLG